MIRIIKRLPADKVVVAIMFLLLQISGAIYLPYMTANIVNEGIVNGDIYYICQQGIFMIGITIMSLIGQVLNTYISAKISYNMSSKLRKDIYNKVLTFSKREYDKFGAAPLITRNINDVTQVQSLVEMGLKFLIIAPLYLLGGIVMTYRLSPKLSLIFIGVIPFLAIGTIVIYRFANPLYEKMQKLLDRLNLLFREGLTGVKVIRAFGREEEDYKKYNAINQNYTKTAIKAGTIMSVFTPFITVLLNLTTIIIIWIGSRSIASGTMEIGTTMAAISYSTQILIGFTILASVILAIPRGKISIERINEILDMNLSIIESSKTEVSKNGYLQFEKVDFSYPGAEKKALEDISFKVKEGETLAIIGSTGDGKTSLINLIIRLYDIDNGYIKIGDVDIRKIKKSELNHMISLVPQKSTLFMGSIRDNMLIAKPDATDEEIWEALNLACAAEFVSNLNGGLDSMVEKAGGNFSGGQKQRICIARALLKDANIYIFDDSFSALDFKTDRIIRESIQNKLSKAITVIVAQRVSAVMNADLIAVLDNGKLVGLGTHEELKKSNNVYKEIIDSQMYKEGIA
ncbi:multidrug ABC transporter ATP-binding protein [Clostridium beijerinckii]|uniref:Multidrug ABC transporter ATP-binding protein n=1 Tax=Clostridium beijerinckii TaxID=1520 RepID=A0A0B5QIV9_CLOBE|nr:ABC transporter ATP-binding protein [Clostridium beijerinckii]AJH00891.1 multidrug ABC transporter ATP-binding protein [Clostridium beijerinckii]